MNKYMRLQMALSNERLATAFKFAGEWPIICMRPHMSLEVAGVRELLNAV